VAQEGWKEASHAGGDVVLVRFQVSNIGRQHEPPPGVNTTSRIVYVRSSDPLRVVVELLDSRSGELMLRSGPPRYLRVGVHSGAHIERERVEQAFHRVLGELAGRLHAYRELVGDGSSVD
jgi:hypothetical protein